MATLVSSYEAYEDLMKKSQEGKEFYEDLEGKASKLLERARALCKTREEERQALLERYCHTHPHPVTCHRCTRTLFLPEIKHRQPLALRGCPLKSVAAVSWR